MSSQTSFPQTLHDGQQAAKPMQWFPNLATRTKLMLGFGLMLLFLIGVIIAAYFGINTLRSTFYNLYDEEYTVLLDLRSLRANQNGIRASLLMILEETAENQQPLRLDIQTRMDRIDMLIASLLE